MAAPERIPKQIVPAGFLDRAKGFADSALHDQDHRTPEGIKPTSGPNREGYRLTEGDNHVRVVRGVDYLQGSESDGTFLASISQAEVDRRLARFADTGESVDVYQHNLGIGDLLPKDWMGEQIVYVITVKARRLTHNQATRAHTDNDKAPSSDLE